MPATKPFADYVVSNIYDSNFLADDLLRLLQEAGSSGESTDCFHEVKAIFAENLLRNLNETQIEIAQC